MGYDFFCVCSSPVSIPSSLCFAFCLSVSLSIKFLIDSVVFIVVIIVIANLVKSHMCKCLNHYVLTQICYGVELCIFLLLFLKIILFRVLSFQITNNETKINLSKFSFSLSEYNLSCKSDTYMVKKVKVKKVMILWVRMPFFQDRCIQISDWRKTKTISCLSSQSSDSRYPIYLGTDRLRCWSWSTNMVT